MKGGESGKSMTMALLTLFCWSLWIVLGALILELPEAVADLGSVVEALVKVAEDQSLYVTVWGVGSLVICGFLLSVLGQLDRKRGGQSGVA